MTMIRVENETHVRLNIAKAEGGYRSHNELINALLDAWQKGRREMNVHVTAWEIRTGSLRKILREKLDKGYIEADDVVWRGPSGDVLVAGTTADLDETDYAEYVDKGTVGEWVEGDED